MHMKEKFHLEKLCKKGSNQKVNSRFKILLQNAIKTPDYCMKTPQKLPEKLGKERFM